MAYTLRMLRIGLISAATYQYQDEPIRYGSNHGTAFASTFNGYNESVVREHEWKPFVRAKKRLEGAKVVKVWDKNRLWAQRLAKACDIPTVADSPEDCATGVDLVLIVDDGSGAQSKYAAYPLKKGIPTFCDKPLAMTAKKAQAVAAIAKQTGTPFMSASSLRFVPDIIKLRDELPKIGPVHLSQVICGNDLIYYGIHALSMAYAVLGRGAISAVNVGQPGMNVVRIRFEDHRDVVLMVGARDWMRSGYQISVFGKQSWQTVKPNLQNLYWYLLQDFLRYAKTGKASVPIDEEVEVIAALEAGKRSLTEQREVTLAEVMM
ncbi:MAG: Gfo/Idh/MocA family protein [Verrucomicrobiia bacterium]|jgi:predicted dehydrogenase